MRNSLRTSRNIANAYRPASATANSETVGGPKQIEEQVRQVSNVETREEMEAFPCNGKVSLLLDLRRHCRAQTLYEIAGVLLCQRRRGENTNLGRIVSARGMKILRSEKRVPTTITE
jgi:hypothetical protein